MIGKRLYTQLIASLFLAIFMVSGSFCNAAMSSAFSEGGSLENHHSSEQQDAPDHQHSTDHECEETHHNGENLVQIVEPQVQKISFTNLSIGFLHALPQYFAQGKSFVLPVRQIVLHSYSSSSYLHTLVAVRQLK